MNIKFNKSALDRAHEETNYLHYDVSEIIDTTNMEDNLEHV